MTKQEKLQYFAAHPLVTCVIKDAEPYTQDRIEGVDYVIGKVIAERVSYDPDLIALMLKPLDDRTTQEKGEIMDLIHQGNVDAGGILARSLGYACSWGKYSIADLIRAGVLYSDTKIPVTTQPAIHKNIRTITLEEAYKYGMTVPEKYALINVETSTIFLGSDTEKGIVDALNTMTPAHPLWDKLEFVKKDDYTI